MVYSEYVKQRILFYFRMKMSCQKIARCTKEGVRKFIIRYECGTISRKPGTGRKTKLTADIRRMIVEQMQKDDETTGLELKRILEKEGYVASVSSILRWRTEIGWTSKGTSYCQMIREVNKQRYINHLDKVIPEVIECEGGPSGY